LDLPDWLAFSSLLTCSSLESHESSPCEVAGKGKALVVTEGRPRALRWPRPSSSFMEDARRPPPFHLGGHHLQKSRPLIKQPRSSFAEAGSRAPVVNSVLALESRGPLRFSAPDPNCWRLVVHKRKRKPSGSKPRSSHKGARKVPADLIGLCFNCFHDDHVSRNYPYPAC
jgi:hypothetical protein